MVDAVVSFVVQRLGDYLIKEAVFLSEVRDKVQVLKNELEWMQRFIEDAEEKQVEDATIRKWLSDTRDIAYDIEDVVDTFVLKVNDGKISSIHLVDEGGTLRRPGFFASIMKCCCISNHEVVNLYSIGKQIEALRKRINELLQRRRSYRLEDIGEKREEKSNILNKLKELRKIPSFVLEENLVGFEDETSELLAKLLDEEPQRLVISIFGMGGLGKTTLAKMLYHNHDVKNKFSNRAWVSISQNYNTRDVLLGIIESFNIIEIKENVKGIKERNAVIKKIEKMNKGQLERYIHEFLQRGLYLLVMDDVWQKETWESLKTAFPDNKNGSRVIITTRIKEVAERSDLRTHTHELQFLRESECWKLFCQKAFQNSNVDERLEKIGREMVEKCRGLPLAIVVLGGLLSTKKPHEWRRVRDDLWRHLRGDSIHIFYLLDLSFKDLPYQLKLCFLYLGLFPEDFEIKVQNLIRLLVAEGFIQEDGDLIMEDVAENNLNKLIDRSLVQVEKRCWGRVRTCRLHDLLRNLAIEKAKELNFIHICNEIRHSSSHSSFMSSSRRQAIYSREWLLQLQQLNPLSRSLLFFGQLCQESHVIHQELKQLSRKFGLLRVLDVDVFSLSLPNEIGKLILLKYLGLRGDVRHLPSSIVNMQRLQTLKLNTRDYITLPAEIFQLLELRHLVGYFTGPLPIDNLRNLLTLHHIIYESWLQINPEGLVHLRELRLQGDMMTTEMAFSLETVAKLKSLRSLSVWLGPDPSITSLQSLAHCPCLVELRLNGVIKNLPRHMDELLPNLESLMLENSLLEDDPMPSLEKLPSLMFLVLEYGFYIGKKMICRAHGFPRLEVLQILDSQRLEDWQVDEDAMPMLRGLKIQGHSTNLTIPERLTSIPLPGEWECTDTLFINKSSYADI